MVTTLHRVPWVCKPESHYLVLISGFSKINARVCIPRSNRCRFLFSHILASTWDSDFLTVMVWEAKWNPLILLSLQRDMCMWVFLLVLPIHTLLSFVWVSFLLFSHFSETLAYLNIDLGLLNMTIIFSSSVSSPIIWSIKQKAFILMYSSIIYGLCSVTLLYHKVIKIQSSIFVSQLYSFILNS